MSENPLGPAPLNSSAKVILVVWCALLVPWVFISALADGILSARNTTAAHIFVASIWIYPFFVGISLFCKRKYPRLVWLPTLSFAGVILSFIVELRSVSI